MTKKKPGGYEYNYQVNRGLRKCSEVRGHMRRLVENHLGAQTQAVLMTRVALGIAEVEEVLRELEGIGEEAKRLRNEDL